jgi:hypothetical protein
MQKCRSPDHPHCTVWVLPGDSACAHGHPQPASEVAAEAIVAHDHPHPASEAAAEEPVALRAHRRAGDDAIRPRPAPQPPRPHLHVSGFDPRAAGGRQAIKLSLRGMPAELAPQLAVLVQSDLHLHGGERHVFTRTLGGGWLPLFIEFSSRGLEHGQHRIDVELHSRGEAGTRTWVCTLVMLVPRPDASLTEIHHAFLSTHKNVRVTADDGAIARVTARLAGPLDIAVDARDASIAQLDLDAPPGRQDLGFASIAWDEDLIEVDVPAAAQRHPCPTGAACLVNPAPDAHWPRHLRLFARDQFVLGRAEVGEGQAEAVADLPLAHFGEDGQDLGGLTRRLSARHAVIRRGRDGFEIEDVSRYGLLLDGSWPGKHVPVALRTGMRIELTASIREVVVLVVSALLAHGVLLHRADAGRLAEGFLLLEPECLPAMPPEGGWVMPDSAPMPLLFHRHGGLWHLDATSGKETALTPGMAPGLLAGLAPELRFAPGPYPDTWVERVAEGDRRRLPAGPQQLGI